MTPKELKALVALLDDTDATVFRQVSERILLEGPSIIPMLERSWEESSDPMLQKRIEDIVQTIQFQNAKVQLERWVASGTGNLLEGSTIVASYLYPNTSLSILENEIDLMKDTIWQELNQSLTPLEKIRVLNHFFLEVFRFNSSPADLFSPDSHFINKVLETRRGGPVCLSIIFSILSQKLGMPVYCVCLPQNFIVVYLNRYANMQSQQEANPHALFYVNPFGQGQILGYDDIRNHLERMDIEILAEYFKPCTNQDSVAQLIASLMMAYQKADNMDKVNDLRQLLNVVGTKKE